MKATIKISGQIGGNFALLQALQNNHCTVEKSIFNGYFLNFNTKKQAYKALWDGFNYLKKGDNLPHRFSYSPKYSIQYDASTAILIDERVYKTSD